MTRFIVGAAALVWLYLSPPSWLAGMSAAFSTKPEPKPDRAAQRKQPRHVAAARKPVTLPVEVIDVPVANPANPFALFRDKFPIDQDIPSDATKSMIVSMYGRPDLRVTKSDAGQLYERFIYIERATGRLTAITFANSTLTGSRTEAM